MTILRRGMSLCLAEMFFAAIQSVTTSMSDSTKGRYRTTAEYFLRYLAEHHPGVMALDQLRRDPHVLGWLAWLASQHPPLVKSTRYLHVISLRRLMEELAWLHERPAGPSVPSRRRASARSSASSSIDSRTGSAHPARTPTPQRPHQQRSAANPLHRHPDR